MRLHWHTVRHMLIGGSVTMGQFDLEDMGCSQNVWRMEGLNYLLEASNT